MTYLSILAAGAAYFILGGLWFTPLFGKQWDTAVGFARPPKWKPALPYYLIPLAGCLIAAGATAILVFLTHAQTLYDFLHVGLIAGVGYAAGTTATNAVAPNMPRPYLYAAVVGSYHIAGNLLSAAVLYWLS